MDERVENEAAPAAGSGSAETWLWVLLGLAVALGIWARFSVYGQTVVADELSTLWIVQNHGLLDTVRFVTGDGEISPPLYFILAWFASKLGSAPELIRLPSMLFAFASLPLFYLLGLRLFNRSAGILATVIAALSPMLVYLGANGRAYSVMLFFLLATTLAMLYAIDGGKRRWWVLYAVATALAMYTHYTCAFILAGQLLWLLIYVPGDRLKALLANAGAVVLYIPWIPGYLSDSDSPTTPILEALQGYGFEAKKLAVEQVLFWQVTAQRWTLADRWDVLLLSAGTLLALVAALVLIARRTGIVDWFRNLDRGIVLVLVLIFATPVGALLLGRVSTDVFGTRNLAAAWMGIPLGLGALLVAAGRVWGTIATGLVVAGLTIGAVGLTDEAKTELRFKTAAEYVESQARPGDAVVSTSHLTPVPLSPLDAYLDPDVKDYRLGLPKHDPPFLPGKTETPDPGALWEQALADSKRIFVVGVEGAENLKNDRQLFVNGAYATGLYDLPPEWKVGEQHQIDGILPITVTLLERRNRPSAERTGTP
ncbi:MAG TPA: glycosyltransferase family 39 protein [Solirubrobacterales bacterium]|nr:glycosyltransferase family 39 protein [Solirubrobacterales bacterium]